MTVKLLKKIKLILKPFYSKIRGKKNKFIKVNLEETFPCFAPRSGGDFLQKAELTIESINETIPAINLLIENLNDFSKPLSENLVKDIKEVLEDNSDILDGEELANLFRYYGSDKAGKHDYYWFYGKILKNRKKIRKILEIGLGTNNLDVVSNMGKDGKPGASLRAFRDFCPNAQIYGADIDERILFDENRIKTFELDQTKLNTFNKLSKLIGGNFDLIIDDGLHEPLANIYSLNFAIKHIKVKGWVVIEDIYPSALPIWQTISFLFKGSDYETFLYRNKHNRFIFAVNKIK